MMSIVLKKIKKEYSNTEDKIVVLNNVSLSVESGDVISILGHSGVGKSTLLGIFSGVLYPDEGEVFIDNELLGPSNASSIRKRKIGVLFQDNNLLPEFNVMDNVLLPLIIIAQLLVLIFFLLFFLQLPQTPSILGTPTELPQPKIINLLFTSYLIYL